MPATIDLKQIRRALLSVTDKSGLVEFAQTLAAFGVELISTGGTKTIWTSNARTGDTRLVLAEAVIDAFSYHQLHHDERTRYVTTGGSFGPSQASFIARAIAKVRPRGTIVIATDRDAAGERMAQQIAGVAGDAAVLRDASPIGKDWNDYLQEREQAFIRAVRSRQRGVER